MGSQENWGETMKTRNLKNEIFKIISYAAGALTVLILVGILGKITIEALPSLNLNFIFRSESEVKGFGGGIGNAVVGTIILSIKLRPFNRNLTDSESPPPVLYLSCASWQLPSQGR